MLADTSRFLSGPHRLRGGGRPPGRRPGPDPLACSWSAWRPQVALVVVVLASGAVDKRTLELARRAERRPGGGGVGATWPPT